ncbi:MAG: enoyl-CoA hydratase-related protein [bacterium]
MTSFNKINCELQRNGQVLWLTLNAPKGNVLDKEMMTELTHAIQQTGSQASVKALVFEGAGKHFSFGASVPEHQKAHVADMLKTFHQLMKALVACRRPSLALVRGQCLGGGLELAAFCNWIFASEDAMFGQPEIKLAVFPPVASLILPHRIGQSAADNLILSGRSITAAEAKQLGLVHSVSGDPAQEVETLLAEHILPKSSQALQFAVQSARFEMHEAFLKNIDRVEKMYVEELMATADANEGIQAFMEKRPPAWENG